jgi:CDP-glucose 4,6-dehydratase
MESMEMKGEVDPTFWRSQKVLLTGHTGFKGAWCALWLARMGAKVTGFALPPETDPNLFVGAGVASDVESHFGDLQHRDEVRRIVEKTAPQIVLHFAAQAIVRRAAREPVETVATNILGTMHLLDALREVTSARVILAITSDKVYENNDAGIAFREGDELGGREIYGASKAATEILTRAMASAYFADGAAVVATARGGNVIGGGDYAEDRLVPDVVRAVARGEMVILHHPDAIRPWQYVLDCIAGYLVYVQALAADPSLPRALNVGPEPQATLSVRHVAETMLAGLGSDIGWRRDVGGNSYEAQRLTLDTTLIRNRLGWQNKLPGPAALAATSSWYRAVAQGQPMRAITLAQIDAFTRYGGHGVSDSSALSPRRMLAE